MVLPMPGKGEMRGVGGGKGSDRALRGENLFRGQGDGRPQATHLQSPRDAVPPVENRLRCARKEGAAAGREDAQRGFGRRAMPWRTLNQWGELWWAGCNEAFDAAEGAADG